MLSYRHGFHAGNFADVLKHTVLVAVLDYLGRKPKPLVYIDTHAGAGSYDLGSDFPQKKREYLSGIGRLWDLGVGDAPAAVSRYVDLVRTANAAGVIEHYPGSPAIARSLLTAADRLILFERHGNEAEALRRWAVGDRRLTVREEDGLAGCIGLLPPPSKRALLLIDPAYEIKSDYEQVVKTLAAAHRRFATGVYMLWYPVVERARVARMVEAIKATGIRRIARFELGIAPDSDGFGMTASGVVIINPPFVLGGQMDEALPWLADRLSESGEGWFRSETLVGE